MTQEVKDTVRGMVIWTCICDAVLTAIVLLIMKFFSGWELIHTQVLLGFVAGGALAVFMAVHMAKSLTVSVEMDEGSALIYTRKKYLIRTVIIFAVMIGLFFTGMFNILAMLGGLLCLKPATYVQMFFQKDVSNISEKEEEK